VYQPLVVLMDGFSYFIDLHRRQITTDYPLLGFLLLLGSVRASTGSDALNRPQRHLRIVSSPTSVDPKSHTLSHTYRCKVEAFPDVDRDAPFRRSSCAIALCPIPVSERMG
jgi:hypothetical protein